jgi:hypothetical protein
MKYISSQNGPWRGIFGWNDTTAVQSISFGTNLNGTGVSGPYVQNIGYNGSATATLTNNGLYIVSFTFTGTTTGVGYNGQDSLTAGTVSSYSGSSTSIGICTETNGTQMTAVYLGELLIYNTVLGTTDRRNVEGYLSQKWGLTASLPAVHPGLTQSLPLGKPGSLAATITTPNYLINITTFSAANINLVGGAVFSSGRLEVTDSSTQEASAGWFTSRVSLVQKFTSVFNMSFQSTQADGATFCIQNINNTSAIGSSGGALGFQGIGANSLCITFKTYDGGAANFSTEVLTGGAAPNLVGASGILDTQLGLTAAGTTWNLRVTVNWNGTNLNYTILNTDNGNSFTSNAAYNIPSIVGTNNPYIGFTGGTGGLQQFCYVTSWQYYTY